jgi:ABC-type Mn2+/Zn2+ transport system ATPase subunit
VGEVGEDAPVTRFVRVRQRRARHLATESQVIELALQRTQTGSDVAQTLPIGQLSEGHRQIVIPAGEASHPQVALIDLTDLLYQVEC